MTSGLTYGDNDTVPELAARKLLSEVEEGLKDERPMTTLEFAEYPKAFLTIHRQEAGYRPVHERIDDFSEVEQTLNSSDRRRQASRCMDCGVPLLPLGLPVRQ